MNIKGVTSTESGWTAGARSAETAEGRVARAEKTKIPSAGVVATPIRSKLCVRRRCLRSIGFRPTLMPEASEFSHFLWIAKGSTGEVSSQLYHAKDNGYVTEDDFNALQEQLQLISAMLYNLIAAIRTSPIKGQRYK